jgi:hypothetical protein
VPRPTTKVALLEAADHQYARLLALIDALPPEAREAEFGFEDRDRNVRDVVGHLHAWHLMLLGWYAEGMTGGKPAIPAPGHTWRTLPGLNAEIWRQCQDVDLEAALAGLATTHAQVRALIEAHTEDELWEKRRYGWTGSTSMGAYLVSATSSHYDWAVTKLRRHSASWRAASGPGGV